MRYRIVALLFLAAVPAMTALAAPAPEPYGILDIGPGQGKPCPATLDTHRRAEVRRLFNLMIGGFWTENEVKQLPSIARRKDPRDWLTKHLRVTDEDGGTRLRLTFGGGNRAEQVALLNALLRKYMKNHEEYIQQQEARLRDMEACIDQSTKRIESAKYGPTADMEAQKGIDEARAVSIPKQRTLLRKLKQVAVVRWAK